jgi:gentisate 1,2-dioxygenase
MNWPRVMNHHAKISTDMTKHQQNPIKNAISGEFVAFSDYLDRTKRERSTPVLWQWHDIARLLSEFPAGERGSIALGHHGGGNPLAAAPGLSTTIQVVAGGAHTSPHAHSFWHLYIVRSGTGLFFTDENDQGAPLAAGDILFIPALAMHSFSNPAAHDPLVLFAIQNLPLVAELGVLARQAAGGSLDPVYAVSNGGIAKAPTTVSAAEERPNDQSVRILHMPTL